jgi:hypothetical protein
MVRKIEMDAMKATDAKMEDRLDRISLVEKILLGISIGALCLAGLSLLFSSRDHGGTAQSRISKSTRYRENLPHD